MSEKRTIQIGEHSIEAWYDENADDGFRYFAELDANSSWPNEGKFYVSFFSGVGCAAIPDSTHLVIFYTSSEFRKVNFVVLKKIDSVCELGITLALNYREWEMAESISKFVYRFVDSLKQELGLDAKPVKMEYGYFVECWYQKTKVTDILSWYSEMEHSIEMIYQRELVNAPVSSQAGAKYGDGRFHWWIRYVIVPLLGSGTIAAVIAKIFLK